MSLTHLIGFKKASWLLKIVNFQFFLVAWDTAFPVGSRIACNKFTINLSRISGKKIKKVISTKIGNKKYLKHLPFSLFLLASSSSLTFASWSLSLTVFIMIGMILMAKSSQFLKRLHPLFGCTFSKSMSIYGIDRIDISYKSLRMEASAKSQSSKN